MGLKIGGRIERVNARELTYSEFVEKYMVPNQPVVLTGLMDDWRACKDWVLPNGKPNLHFFSTHFGKSIVQVADCGTREFTDQKRIEITVSEFVDHWLRDCGAADGFLLYLKDWHFVKEYPEYTAYRTPMEFSDDWLNFYLDKFRMHNDPDTYSERNEISCSDYRFVYMGSKGLTIVVVISFLNMDTSSRRCIQVIQLVCKCLWEKTVVFSASKSTPLGF